MPPTNESPASPELSATDSRLIRALEQYQSEIDQGRRPDRAKFLAEHADIADELAECLEGLNFVLATRPRLQARSQTDPAGLTEFVQPAQPLGDFQIVREIGRGGMGIVYEAVQLSLGRRVALKVLPFAAAFDAKRLQRFRTEAQAAAQLHHTNIVPVFAVGQDRGLHFYAMQLIEGQSLAVLIQELRSQRDADEPRTTADPLSNDATVSAYGAALTTQRSTKPLNYFRAIVRLVHQAALALEYAHQFGIIHRDIKPANLIVGYQPSAIGHRPEHAGPNAEGRQPMAVWITDFGLAQVRDEAELTETGDFLGTLRYMSPEQASGQRSLLDHRTDVYSLGVTLYELATLTPIFAGNHRQVLLQQILTQEPPAPRSLDKSIPVELETIILKAIGKSPQERYATAQAFADDLERFLDDKPILARRPTLLDRSRKWMRRHPSFVGAAVVLLVLGVVGFGVSTALIAREQARTQTAYQAERQRAEEAEERFQLARRSADEMIRIADEELTGDPVQQNLRRRLLEAALAYYQEFIAQRRDDPDAQAELEVTRDRVQRILADLALLQGAWQHMLLNDAGVQDDLKLSSEQREKLRTIFPKPGERRVEPLPDFHKLSSEERSQRLLAQIKAHEAAIGAILTPDQRARLRQIALQSRGPQAFREPDVVAKLELTPEQREKLRDFTFGFFVTRMDRPRGEGPLPGPPPGAPGPHPPRLQRPDETLLKSTMAEAENILTGKQKERWRELIGEPFQGPLPRIFMGPVGPFGPPPGFKPPPPPIEDKQ